jgi:hypothetical protein
MTDKVFEVERILAERADGGEFLVKWRGYDLHQSSWEPRAHIYDIVNESEDVLLVRNRQTGDLGELHNHFTVQVQSDKFHRVDKILKKRRESGLWVYQVKFKNFDNRHNRWLPLKDMTPALQEEVLEMHETLPTAKRIRRTNPFVRA